MVISVQGFSQFSTPFEQVVYDLVGEPYRSGAFSAPWGAHEGGLHGVPGNYDWAAGARPGSWLNYAENQAISTWGQVYEWKENSPETNIRVQVRNMVTYSFANGEWLELERDNFGGTNFTEDFRSSSSLSQVRSEQSGGISFNMVEGYNFHWWISKWPRATLPAGTEALYVACEIRLIPNDDPDVDLSQAKYLAGVSNDYYPTPTSSGSGPWPSVAITRHKFLTAEWQTLTSYVAGPMPSSVEDFKEEILSRPLPPGVLAPGAPTVDFLSPVEDSVFIAPDSILIEAEASDEDGIISRVDFFMSDSLIGSIDQSPFSISLTDPDPGEYQLHAIAFDDLDNHSAPAFASFSVLASQPPEVAITSPQAGQEFGQGDSITLTASAQDNDGTVLEVTFYANGSPVDTDDTEPFSIKWVPQLSGNVEIYASATDNSGTKGISEPVGISIVGNIYYEEDFSDGKAQSWRPLSGTWVVDNEEYESKNAEGNEIAINDRLHLTKYSFAFKANPKWNNWFGSIFHFQNDSNYYALELSIPLDSSYIFEVVDNSIDTIARGYFPNGVSLSQATIEILNDSASTTVFVNEEKVIESAETNAFTSGKIGLYTHWNPVEFDDIIVQGLGKYYPDIALSTPSETNTFLVGDEVEIICSVSDEDGFVETVNLYHNLKLVAEFTNPPYTHILRNITEGEHEIYAVAVDDEGLTTNTTLMLQVSDPTSSPAAELSAEQEANIYPNPVSIGTFYVVPLLSSKTQLLEFYSADGTLVFSRSFLNPEVIEIEVGKLKGKGIYLFRLVSEDTMKMGKLVVH